MDVHAEPGTGISSFCYQIPMVTTESGLQYKDIKVGQGPSPPVGYQVHTKFRHVFVALTNNTLMDCSLLAT